MVEEEEEEEEEAKYALESTIVRIIVIESPLTISFGICLS